MTVIKNILNFTLALSIVAFSCGFTISRMQCNMSGKVTVKLFNVKDCCGDDNEDRDNVDAPCCNIYSQNLTLDSFSFTKYVPDFCLTFSVIEVFTKVFSIDGISIATFSFAQTDHPPPLFGTQFLHFISVLII